MLRRAVVLQGTVPLLTVAAAAAGTGSGVTAMSPPGRSSTRSPHPCRHCLLTADGMSAAAEGLSWGLPMAVRGRLRGH
jgi:hypothetical protein